MKGIAFDSSSPCLQPSSHSDEEIRKKWKKSNSFEFLFCLHFFVFFFTPFLNFLDDTYLFEYWRKNACQRNVNMKWMSCPVWTTKCNFKSNNHIVSRIDIRTYVFLSRSRRIYFTYIFLIIRTANCSGNCYYPIQGWFWLSYLSLAPPWKSHIFLTSARVSCPGSWST